MGVQPKKYAGRPLAETHPHLATEVVDQSLAAKVTAGSGKKLSWRCKAGHEWEAKVANRVNGIGCPYCSGQKAMPGFNDMATTHPRLAAELVGDATKVMAGTNKKLAWMCKLGHEWWATGNSRLRGAGCPCCFGRTVWSGFNDMSTTHPDLAAELIGDSSKVIAGTSKKLRWRCRLGHEWEAKGCDRVNGTGCPKCAKYGYNSLKPGVFYLVHRPGQFKIGIMNLGATRLNKHHRSGWSILDTIELSGESARKLEAATKIMLEKNGVPTGAKAFRKKFDGFTEAWKASDLKVTSIDDLLEKLGTSFDALLAC